MARRGGGAGCGEAKAGSHDSGPASEPAFQTDRSGGCQRNDLTILFGAWNIYTGDPQTAWTEIGSTCGSDSNANAVKVSIVRAAGTVYGPVSNLFGGILGFNTSKVAATAIAYLGYTNEVPTGGVQVPLALPGTGTNILLRPTATPAGWRVFLDPKRPWLPPPRRLPSGIPAAPRSRLIPVKRFLPVQPPHSTQIKPIFTPPARQPPLTLCPIPSRPLC